MDPEEAAGQATTIELPMQLRRAPITPATIDSQTRTFEVVWSIGARVRRYDWRRERYFHEELSMDPSHVRLTTLNAGAPFLDSHQQWSLEGVLGVVERAWIANGEGRAVIRFEAAGNTKVDAVWKRIEEKILRAVSCGYRTHKLEETGEYVNGSEPVYRAVDWEPAEISLVAMPADPAAGIRSGNAAGAQTYPCNVIQRASAQAQEQNMDPEDIAGQPAGAPEQNGGERAAPTPPAAGAPPADGQRAAPPAPAAALPALAPGAEPSVQDQVRAGIIAERTRSEEITRIGDVFGLQTEAAALVRSGATIEAARAALQDKWAENGAATRAIQGIGGIRMVADAGDKFVEGMTAGLLARAGHGADLGAARNEYSGLTLRELAREWLHINNVRASSDPMQMVGQALTIEIRAGEHTTSDFPTILANIAGKALLKAYEETEETFPSWTAVGSLSDFKPAHRVDLGLFDSLPEVKEGAEYTHGTFGERGETIQLATYGKLFTISRQAIINDDLSLFSRVPQRMGRAARRTVGNLVYLVLTSNPTLSDGIALFHANHGNLVSSGAGAPNVAQISGMKTLMAKQKDPDNKAVALNIRPKHILVPVALEDAAKVVVTSEWDHDADKLQKPNPHRGNYNVIADARLDVASAAAWYMAADGNVVDTIEVAYLNGVQVPTIERQEGWKVDGSEFKVRLDAGVKALGYRGLTKNNGG